jgi:hypothetical protein
MRREMTAVALEDARRLIENHIAWTARAFCMATAELRGSFEPVRSSSGKRRERRRSLATTQSGP